MRSSARNPKPRFPSQGPPPTQRLFGLKKDSAAFQELDHRFRSLCYSLRQHRSGAARQTDGSAQSCAVRQPISHDLGVRPAFRRGRIRGQSDFPQRHRAFGIKVGQDQFDFGVKSFVAREFLRGVKPANHSGFHSGDVDLIYAIIASKIRVRQSRVPMFWDSIRDFPLR